MIGEDGAEHALETEANSLSEVAHVGGRFSVPEARCRIEIKLRCDP